MSTITSRTYSGKGQTISYGNWILFDKVTSINIKFGNQTIRSPVDWTDFEKWLGFHGGNVAVTIHGYFEDSVDENGVVTQTKDNKRIILEMIRNGQAALAHIPGTIPVVGIGIGNLLLWGLSWMFWFASNMVFQTNMVIKSMEFNETGRLLDKYEFQIVFEKISFGIIQYIIDFFVSLVGGILTFNANPQSAIGSGGYGQGDSPRGGITQNSLITTILGSVGQDIDITEGIGDITIQNIVSSVEDTLELGQIIEEVERPKSYDISPKLDDSLSWMNIPFLDTFPQTFTTKLGDYSYDFEWTILDPVNDEDFPEKYLHLTLYKDGELIYIGKIELGIQFTFDNSISLYISNFDLFVLKDGTITHTINGMVADRG